ncbi:uncharacterized protein LOC119980965 [Tripterygium wilfordii]|uniref:uncharacterized protein LOC119980965 n=1 Tax=Tripterygium wilfordii TaxID=458696 RepID=UPI0018F7EB72|nr:uncharacterized protein LOC119980965 [Tripterygium wilfordii]
MDTGLKLSMKLLIDPKGRRVLFAEAGKDVVDFLFSILSLPLGAVATLQNPKALVYGVGNLYQSIEDLRDLHMIPNKNIDSLVDRVRVTYANTSNSPPILLSTGKSPPTKKSYYKCAANNGNRNCGTYVTLDPKSRCPCCSKTMSSPLTLVGSTSSSSSSSVEGGFVKGGVTYMITDDLLLKPMSTLSTVTLISSLNLKDVGALKEKTVRLTMDNVGKLLRASLQTKNVLTTAFFEEKMVVKEEKSFGVRSC